MRLKDKQTGVVGDYFLTNHKKTKIAVVPNGKSPSEGVVFDTLAELCERFEDAPEERKYGGRVREEGDACWYIDEEGDIIEDCWMPTELQLIIYEAGNMFWTIGEAEKEVARRKAYVILKEDTKGFKPDWKDYNTKWFVRYCRSLGGVLRPDWTQRDSAELIYFSSSEDAEASIKTHRQEWLDYLGIEEEK